MSSSARLLPLAPFLNGRDYSDAVLPSDESELLDTPLPSLSGIHARSESWQSVTTALLDRLESQDLGQGLPSYHNTEKTETKNTEKAKRTNKARQYFQGWRMGVSLCACTAGTVLLTNVIFTVWGSVDYGVHESLVTIHEGGCIKSRNLSLWLHLAISVLSTLLLGASNYCMQCLSSPSREEIDSAHARHIWLDIGVPSVRNLRRLSWNKILLWWALAVSTVPLHLLYNSAIFSTIGANQYEVYVGSPNLGTGVEVNWSMENPWNPNGTLQDFQQASSKWDKFDIGECWKVYSPEFVTGHSTLLAITPLVDSNSSLFPYDTPLYYVGYFGANPIYCQREEPCVGNNGWIRSDADSNSSANTNTLQPTNRNIVAFDRYNHQWTVPVQYCLSKPAEHCTVQFSIWIMGIVIGCNMVKLYCMVKLLFHQRAKPLVTLGDAIESFLAMPDPTTENMCLADKNVFSKKVTLRSAINSILVMPGPSSEHMRMAYTIVSSKKGWPLLTTEYGPRRLHCFSSASRERWFTCNMLSISTLGIAGYLLSNGLANESLKSRSITSLWHLGFGKVTFESLLGIDLGFGAVGLHLSLLIANSPQLLLSFLFLTYNSLFTCMLLAREWSEYAHVRKPLRVTSPAGSQRSTYRLQLPYKYGVPLLVLSGTLHWLVSQSLFLARVEFYRDDGTILDMEGIATLGYSCIAIITVIGLGGIVVVLAILHGCRRYRRGIPLAGSCSAAISAACHRQYKDINAPYKPLMWGAIGSSGPIGHCCFTSFEVTEPVTGQMYA